LVDLILRVHMEPGMVPPGWGDPVDVDANHAGTGPDGSLFLSKQTFRDEGIDLATGRRRLAQESRLVLVLRGGHRPIWRWVESVTPQPPPEEPSWTAAQESGSGERS
jgi:hypothetical protein